VHTTRMTTELAYVLHHDNDPPGTTLPLTIRPSQVALVFTASTYATAAQLVQIYSEHGLRLVSINAQTWMRNPAEVASQGRARHLRRSAAPSAGCRRRDTAGIWAPRCGRQRSQRTKLQPTRRTRRRLLSVPDAILAGHRHHH
jgi:hypothetical protein